MYEQYRERVYVGSASNISYQQQAKKLITVSPSARVVPVEFM